MAYFELSSDITIGNFRFSGVHDVHIKRSIHSLADTATIKIPSIGTLSKKGKAFPVVVTTGNEFNDGDAVTIKLGYNGDLQTEFKGFVKRRDLDMPLEVTCEGYSWLLRRSTIKQFVNKMAVKDILALATSDTGPHKINVQCAIDLTLEKIPTMDRSAFDLIGDISSYTDGCVNCFFIQPDTLWCGLIYTPYANNDDAIGAGKVSYRLGYNVVKDNSLKVRDAENDPVSVRYNTRQANGEKVSQTSDAYSDSVRTHSKILNQVKDAGALKQLANEKAYKLNYTGYEGSIKAFLQPYAGPGYIAYITDDRYPERNGSYVVESVEVHFGVNGARRLVELGPRLSSKEN